MAKSKGTVESTEDFLRSVALPEQTETYTVISHGDIIDKVNEQLNKNGFTITEVEYFHQIGGQIAKGVLYLECDKDPDMGMMFTWWNSYNKQVRFGCAVGGFIIENKAQLIGTEGLSWMRKHTGTSDQEAWDTITELIKNANNYFDKIIVEKNHMKAMPLSVEDYGCIMGALYFEHDLITATQASAVKNERKKPSVEYQDKDTLWGLYKILMFGIDGMDLRKWAKSQQKLHHMIMIEYLVIQEDKVQELADAMVEPLKSNNELPLSNISGDLVETNESFQWNVKETEIQKMEGPGLEEESFIGETQEVTAEELAAKHGVEIPAVQMSEDQIELIKEEHGVQEAPQVQEESDAVEPPEDQFEKHLLTKGHSSELVNYFMENHYDSGVSWNDNQEAFDKWAPEKSPTQQELEEEVDDSPQINGIPQGNTISDTDDDDLTPVASAEGDNELSDLMAQTNIAVETDAFEDELEKALALPSDETTDDSDVESDVKPVANLDKPVEIMSPEESKQKTSKTEEFEFPTDLDNPEKLKKAEINLPEKEEKKSEGLSTKTEPQKEEEEKEDFLDVTAHDGLEVPAEILQEQAVIEKKMAELYGSVRPYNVERTDDNVFITIDETQESFFIPVE